MTTFEAAQRRVKKLLYLKDLQDFIARETYQKEVNQRVAARNPLLPEDPHEEPFFVIMDIDWSQYGLPKAKG